MYTAKSAGYHFHSLSVWRQGLEVGGIWEKALRIIRAVTVELFSYSAQCFLQDLSSDKIMVRIFFIGPTQKHYIRFQGHTDYFPPFRRLSRLYREKNQHMQLRFQLCCSFKGLF